MSELHDCANCSNRIETAWGRDAPDLCRQCRRVEERLARGGRRLSGTERAAVAEFLGGVVSREGDVVVVEDRVGALVLGEDGVVDMATSDGERAALGVAL